MFFFTLKHFVIHTLTHTVYFLILKLLGMGKKQTSCHFTLIFFFIQDPHPQFMIYLVIYRSKLSLSTEKYSVLSNLIGNFFCSRQYLCRWFLSCLFVYNSVTNEEDRLKFFYVNFPYVQVDCNGSSQIIFV